MTRKELSEILLVVFNINGEDYYVSKDNVFQVNGKETIRFGNEASFDEMVLYLSKNKAGEVDERKWLLNNGVEMEFKLMFSDDWKLLQDCDDKLVKELYYKFRKIFFNK